MLDYEYREFIAMDRPLDPQQLAGLRAWGPPDFRVTATSLVHEYHGTGSYRPSEHLLREHFDAHLEVTGEGSHRLMVAFPRSVLRAAIDGRYLLNGAYRVWMTRNRLILDLPSDGEPSGTRWDPGDRLARMAAVRSEVLAGDMRLFYLGWLSGVQEGYVLADDVEPPVPPGLGELSGALREITQFLRIDGDMIAAAAQASPRTRPASPVDLPAWIGSLPCEEKDALLAQVMSGHGDLVRAELQDRYRSHWPGSARADEGRRAVAELWTSAEFRRRRPRGPEEE